MDTREYFVYLLSCHLNGVKPRGERRGDWQQIYDLAEKNHVTAIIAYEVQALPEEHRPKGELLEKFRRSLDESQKKFDSRLCSLAIFMSTLTSAGIPHLIIKGTSLRPNYPVPALRSGSDIDVIVRQTDYIRAIEALKSRGLEEISVKSNEAQMKWAEDVFDIHTEMENINIQSKIYFSTPFDDISEAMGCTYKLKPVYHLLYIVTHIAHHLQAGGSGIRMIMDIDVIIRNYHEIDLDEFFALCENIHIGKTASALIALAKKWFNTPAALNFTFEDRDMSRLYSRLSKAIIGGKVFGAKNTGGESESKTKSFLFNLFKKASYAESEELTEAEEDIYTELGIDPQR